MCIYVCSYNYYHLYKGCHISENVLKHFIKIFYIKQEQIM